MGEFVIDDLGDPSSFWAHKDEDFVGLVASVGSSRGGGGGKADTAPRRIVDRIRAMAG